MPRNEAVGIALSIVNSAVSASDRTSRDEDRRQRLVDKATEAVERQFGVTVARDSFDGVLGAVRSGGQYQVIIGQNVPKVYDEFTKLGVQGAGAIDENLDAGKPKEKLTAKKVGSSILDYLSKSMVALIPVMLSAAMFRTIAVVAGPQMLNLWSADSDIYNLFYNWLYDAGFYFFPIILGWSAAKQLGASQPLGTMLGGVLIAPELVNLVSAAADTGATTTMIYGIFPAQLNSYANSVLPIILSIPVMTGMHQVLIALGITQIAMVGHEFCVLVAGQVAQFATWGMAFGAFLRLHEKNEKGANFGHFIFGLVGGVTEPALYGCGSSTCMPWQVWLPVASWVVSSRRLAMRPSTSSVRRTSCSSHASSAGAPRASFGLSSHVLPPLWSPTVVTFLFGFTKEQLDADRQAAEAAKLAA